MGAYRLKTHERERSARMLQKRTPYFPKTTKLLSVTDSDGWEKSLRVTGDNLHGNNNNCYWPTYKIPLRAVSRTTGRKFTVTLTGKSAYVDDEDERDSEYANAKICEMKRKGLKPIGHLGMHSFDDYEPASNVPFDVTGTMIEIGRYGPWSNQGMFFRLDLA